MNSIFPTFCAAYGLTGHTVSENRQTSLESSANAPPRSEPNCTFSYAVLQSGGLATGRDAVNTLGGLPGGSRSTPAGYALIADRCGLWIMAPPAGWSGFIPAPGPERASGLGGWLDATSALLVALGASRLLRARKRQDVLPGLRNICSKSEYILDYWGGSDHAVGFGICCCSSTQ
jgi:hypothetical protein